jgi:hypothetical protein
MYRYPVRDLSFFMSQAKGMAFVHLELSMWGSQSDMQLAFHNVLKAGRYYRVKKHVREDLILPELLSDNLSDDILQ